MLTIDRSPTATRDSSAEPKDSGLPAMVDLAMLDRDQLGILEARVAYARYRAALEELHRATGAHRAFLAPLEAAGLLGPEGQPDPDLIRELVVWKTMLKRLRSTVAGARKRTRRAVRALRESRGEVSRRNTRQPRPSLPGVTSLARRQGEQLARMIRAMRDAAVAWERARQTSAGQCNREARTERAWGLYDARMNGVIDFVINQTGQAPAPWALTDDPIVWDPIAVVGGGFLVVVGHGFDHDEPGRFDLHIVELKKQHARKLRPARS